MNQRIQPAIVRGPKGYRPYGNHLRAWSYFGDELMVEGPYNTGKDRMLMTRFHLNLCLYPGSTGIMCRKEYTHLIPLLDTVFDKEILGFDPNDENAPVRRLGGKKPYAYEYWHGSYFDIRGLANIDSIRGPGWNFGYLTQAEECDPDDWSELSGRIRRPEGAPFNQLMANCNPDVPDHWIVEGDIAEELYRVVTRHLDNPRIYNPRTKNLTKYGKAYLKKLDRLPPLRRARGRDGKWEGGTGQVLEFNRSIHVIPNFPIPKEWQRLCAIDWGIRDPFVCLWAAIDPIDRDIHIYRQIYRTGKTVPEHIDHIKSINAANGEYISFYICDPANAEGIQQFQNQGLNAIGGNNSLQLGLDAFQNRLRLKADGKPGFYIHEDTLVELDPSLVLDHEPTELKKEFAHYVHRRSKSTIRPPDKPVGTHHGIDTSRYLIMFVDGPSEALPTLTGAADLGYIKRY